MSKRLFVLLCVAFLVLARPLAQSPARFELVQPELFSAPGGQPNAWADYDGDGDLDLFVGFRGLADRLYRNDNGTFTDVAASVGLGDTIETRAAAWGDYDADGDPDLYVGFANSPTQPNKIYRNDAGRFTDAARDLGIDLRGVSRQPVWIDYDGDGDLDLFAAFRDVPNRLLRNDGAKFTDVSKESRIDDARKTVGAVWWDADADGDFDLFVANQEGDANGFFRNDKGTFTDVAAEVDVAVAGRPKDEGGVGPTLGDIDADGDLDLFVANYGPHNMFRNDKGRFTDVAKASGLVTTGHVTTASFGDMDMDGRPDLYLGAFLASEPNYRDYLFHNQGKPAAAGWAFRDTLPDVFLKHDATHGVQWADFDANGTLDLALTNNDAKGGGHALFRNLTSQRGRLLAVQVVDGRGRMTRPGAEVRVYRAGTRTLVSSGIVDTGSGYSSQNAMPVYVAAPSSGRVDVEVTTIARGVRHLTRSTSVDPASLKNRPLVIRTLDPATRTTTGADGVELAYEVRGRGPALILMHGGGRDRHDWTEHVRLLERDFTVATFDVRAHGESGKPDDPAQYAAARYVEDVHRIADAIGAQRFSIWGFSLGATMTLQLASTSNRVDRAVAAGGIFGQVFTKAMLEPGLARLQQALDKETNAQSRINLAATRAWLIAAPEWPAIEPSSLKCPTLVYAGTEDRNVIDTLRTQTDAMDKAGVQWRLLPGLNHPQAITAMDVVMPMVTEFLKTGKVRETR